MKSLKGLIVLATLMIGSGCATVPPEPPLCLPERPILVEITVDEQQSVERGVLWKFTINDLALKEYARLLEERIKAHDEALDSC